MRMTRFVSAIWAGVLAGLLFPAPGRAQDVQILGLPDYNWYAGCFGTACGNLMGYWDRTGLPGFYTGPTGGGLAPLNNCGSNIGIRSMWASKAGLDGRPSNRPGHLYDYWAAYTIDLLRCGRNDSFSYESTASDPYVVAGRAEHAADCIADFIGLSQRKFSNMNGECDGNIDAFSFVYWQSNGSRRVNFTNAVDIQSGLKAWARWRGYDADVFAQLTEFNPHVPPGTGFTFEDLKAEIDAGYPLLLFLQNSNQTYRSIGSMPRANPEIHGVLAYGYEEDVTFGVKFVYIRTSWGSGDGVYQSWDAGPWLGITNPELHVRGVIGFHPRPRIRTVSRSGGNLTVTWDGPTSQLSTLAGPRSPHSYQLERSPTLQPPNFTIVGPKTTARTMTVSDQGGTMGFFRVRLLAP